LGQAAEERKRVESTLGLEGGRSSTEFQTLLTARFESSTDFRPIGVNLAGVLRTGQAVVDAGPVGTAQKSFLPKVTGADSF